jgi:hypothetical protein
MQLHLEWCGGMNARRCAVYIQVRYELGELDESERWELRAAHSDAKEVIADVRALLGVLDSADAAIDHER